MTPEQKRALAYATAVAAIIGFLFLREYFTVFVIAAIIAYLFNPLYIRLKKTVSANTAASLTICASLLLIIVPVVLVVLLATHQLISVGQGVSESMKGLDLNQIGLRALGNVNDLLTRIPFVHVQLTEASVVDSATSLAQRVGSGLLGYFTGLVTSFLGAFTTVVVFIFVQFSLIRHGDILVKMIRELNPLGRDMTDLYLQKMGAMVRGTVQGQFIIALVQGLLASATIAAVGYPELFFVMLVITTALSIIPLGAGILVMPLGILMALFGNVAGGIIVNLEHLVINTNIDNVLRPKLVPKEARLDPALMLVSVFAGIAWFGYMGIVIGPTLMIVIATTIAMYLKIQKGYTPAPEQRPTSRPSRARLAFSKKKRRP